MNPDIASEGAKGGEQKQANRVAMAQALLADLPPLVTPEDAKFLLAKVYGMVLHGYVAGVAAGAAVRSIEVWLKAVALENDVSRIRELEKRILELEGELAARKREPWQE